MNTTPPMIAWMQCLSEPLRARILRLLDRSELTVAELCTTLQVPQSTVSRHLKVLGDDGWIASRRDGTSNWYRMRLQDLETPQRKLWQVVKVHSVSLPTAELDDLRLEQVLESRRSRSQAFFSSAAEKWDRLRSDLFGTRVDSWALAATLGRETIFGELGCGTGTVSQAVAPWVKKVYAIDGSASMIQSAKKRLREFENIELKKGDLTDIPLEDETLSVALMALVMPYIAEPELAVQEIHRVVRPGGKFVLMDMFPHDRGEYREQMGHLWLGFSEDQIRHWMERAGWVDVQLAQVPPEPEAKGTTLFVAIGTRAR